MKKLIRQNIAILSIIAFLFIFFVTAILLVTNNTIKKENESFQERENNLLVNKKEEITAYFRGAEGELLFLRDSPGTRNYINSGLEPGVHKNEAGENFYEFADKFKKYYQIRIIDYSGKESLRVDNKRDLRTEIIADKDLQDKSDRYYFQEAIILGRDELYVSPIDLNIENGEIEIPYTPVLRIATPLFNSGNDKSGILILNFYFEEILKILPEGMFIQTREGNMVYSKPDGTVGFEESGYDLSGFEGPIEILQFLEDGEIHFIETKFFSDDHLYIGLRPDHELLDRSNQKTMIISSSVFLAFTILIFSMISINLRRFSRMYKAMEKAKTRAEKSALEAKNANELKSNFLSSMSHEIRTPMNAIMGFSELLNNTVEDPRQKQYIASILSSGKTLLLLINDILDLSKIQSGKIDLQYRAVDPGKLFNGISRIFSTKIKEKGLKFITEIDKKLPGALYMDEVRMRQVLFNIVGNSVKFTSSGYIKLRVEGTYIKDKGKIGLVFSVKDTGIGISAEDKKIVFDAFKQSKNLSIKKSGGMGLGLSIAKKLVTAMGGTISVESTAGKGSTFTVKLKNISVASIKDLPEEKDGAFAATEIEDGPGDKGSGAKSYKDGPARIPPAAVKKLPELISILEGEVKSKWEEVTKAFIISDIKDFAAEIESLGKKYKLAVISEWASDISTQADNFDMEKLPGTLKYFSKLVDKLTEMAK